MKSIAIITARGGSKRIPKKNIKDFLGKPIVAYSIEAAIQSGMFDEVMVSTDSEEIAKIAKRYGASVPFFRSPKSSNDFATTADVINEVIVEYQNRGKYFDAFMCIYPTAPFITTEKIKKAFALLSEQESDCVLSIVKYDFPPQRAFAIKDGFVKYLHEELSQCRSQDLEPIYHDCGQFYLCKTAIFLKHHSMVLPKAVPMIMSGLEVQDIDTEEDWTIAELKYKLKKDN